MWPGVSYIFKARIRNIDDMKIDYFITKMLLKAITSK